MTHYIDSWFPTLVYYSDLNCMDKLPHYEGVVLEIFKDIEKDPHPFGESSLSTSFWHNAHGHLYKDDRFTELCSTILEQAVLFCEVLGYPSLKENQLVFTNMWLNLIGPHDYHAQHIHSTIGQAAISGVFYVDSPPGAKICFGSPYRDSYEPVKPWVNNPTNYSKISYDCVPGRLVMFKSNVYHGYDSHRQEKNKISIPFNLSIEAHAS